MSPAFCMSLWLLQVISPFSKVSCRISRRLAGWYRRETRSVGLICLELVEAGTAVGSAHPEWLLLGNTAVL